MRLRQEWPGAGERLLFSWVGALPKPAEAHGLILEVNSHTFHGRVWASQVALVVKNLTANARDLRDAGLTPGWKDPLEEGMATQSSILAWRISWTEESDGLQSIGLQRIRHS